MAVDLGAAKLFAVASWLVHQEHALAALKLSVKVLQMTLFWAVHFMTLPQLIAMLVLGAKACTLMIT